MSLSQNLWLFVEMFCYRPPSWFPTICIIHFVFCTRQIKCSSYIYSGVICHNPTPILHKPGCRDMMYVGSKNKFLSRKGWCLTLQFWFSESRCQTSLLGDNSLRWHSHSDCYLDPEICISSRIREQKKVSMQHLWAPLPCEAICSLVFWPLATADLHVEYPSALCIPGYSVQNCFSVV